MKYFTAILFAFALTFNVAADQSVSSSSVASPVLSSEATDFEYEGEGPGDARGMVYQNGMRAGRDFYLGDYVGFNPRWVYPGTLFWGSFAPTFDAYRK